MRHGLGRAVDSTKESPWKNKTPHQLQRVQFSSITENDDGNYVQSFSLLIETRSVLQSGFEASITAPKVPVRAGIAADLCRISKSKKLIKGKSIHKRTITMKRAKTPSCFEVNLLTKLKGCKEPVKHCREILESDYGGATHYISSITLGAMEFSEKEFSESDISGSIGGSLGVDQFVSFESKTSATSETHQSSTHQHSIGRKDKEDKVLQEAVVQYALTPIADLVQDSVYREHITEAVRLYMRDKKIQMKGNLTLLCLSCEQLLK